MRVALTYSAKGSLEGGAPPPLSLQPLVSALERAGHEVASIAVSEPVARVVEHLQALRPDVIFNVATALTPNLFTELGIPCIAANPSTLSLTLPAPDPQAALLRAAELSSASDLSEVLGSIVKSASAHSRNGSRRRHGLRVGLTFNIKRVDPTQDDAEAEFDSPATIHALAAAIERHGHEIVLLEATRDLPHTLRLAAPDVVFNIAEGVRGRGREAQVPALCELLGIPYTGSDPTTLSLCLDKGLSKQILRAAGIDTADWQVLVTGREALRDFRYPVIVKPNAEGTSKGITSASVVHDGQAALVAARALIDKYGQPALVEEYIVGRELTVALLGEQLGEESPTVLPPMEVVFLGPSPHPVYGFEEKLSFTPNVRYDCPAALEAPDLAAIERTARDAFIALDCRDVARIDMRLTSDGRVFVIEVNPLPGLKPEFSDLCAIATAAGMDYPTLIGAILAGCLKRHREAAGA
jgi:D-alanine-D-alanine ligase